MPSKKTPKQDVYSRITDKIIEDLEKGIRTWLKPWNGDYAAQHITRPLRHNGEPYTGINVLTLWGSAMENGFTSPSWMTFKQAKALNAQVRKDERGSLVVYANKYIKTEQDQTGQDVEIAIPFMKGYTVFNVEQIDGLPDHYYEKPQPRLNGPERIDHAERFFEATGATINHGGNKAFYTPTYDRVQMPYIEAFKDAESYYATLAHEVTHWTRHESRLDRSFGRKRFGDEGYAMEELVAELGSAFLCADLELSPTIREDHSSYIGSWLKVLKNDKRAVFTAAAHAQRAVDLLHSLQEMGEREDAA